MNPIFYHPSVAEGDFILSGEESRHCIKVMRLREEDTIYIVDGKGGYYKAALTGADPKGCAFKVLEKQEDKGKKSFHLHIAIAPPKNTDRLEWFLEKATEIGVDEITPLICDRSERRELKTERLQKILIAAIKQSGRARLPVLNSPSAYKDFVRESHAGQRFIGWCEEATEHLADVYKKGSDAVVLIGPEGDFTPGEVAMAGEKNFRKISLGNNRLRTETAGIVACSILCSANRA